MSFVLARAYSSFCFFLLSVLRSTLAEGCGPFNSQPGSDVDMRPFRFTVVGSARCLPKNLENLQKCRNSFSNSDKKLGRFHSELI
jgi:hypothetical protein